MRRVSTVFAIIVAVHAGAVSGGQTPGAYTEGTAAVTEDGRRVVLLPDGTWRYDDRSLPAQPEANDSHAVLDEICRFTYDYYYISFKKEAPSRDPVRAQLDCLAIADGYARDEIIINDVVQLLQRARVAPQDYRRVLANSMQFACVRNTTATRAFSYGEYKLSQCSEFTHERSKR